MDTDEITMQGIKDTDDIELFLQRLKEKRFKFEIEGRTEIHLFIQGPVMAGVLVGTMFSNWKPVKLYHRPTNPGVPSIYEYWCPLTK
jgi:hypothetical protein